MTTRTIVHGSITTILPALGEEEIRDDLHLRDLGADSVDRVEIIVLALERSGVTAELSRFSEVPDIAGMITLIDALRADQAVQEVAP